MMLGIFFIYQRLNVPKLPVKVEVSENIDKSKLQTIYPSIYVVGSGGHPIANMIPMAAQITAATDNPAKTGLVLMVQTKKKYKVEVTGRIDKGNLYPTVVVGMDDGTNSHEIYAYTMKAAMVYLASHYNIPWCNIVGYSSGGGGVLRYLMAYGNDKKLPSVKKFLSLDGEFNQEINLSVGETLDDVLRNGPIKKSSDYQYFEKNYKKLNKNIEIALIEGDLKSSKKPNSDGAVPWSDAFSVYNLLEKNGNRVTHYMYVTPYYHGSVWKDTTAVAYIENFLYG